MKRHYSYASILRQRTVVAGLTLGLVTIMTGLSIELSVTANKSTISAAVQRLMEPLDPLLDLKTIERLESYQPVSLTTAKGFVQELRNRPDIEVENQVTPQAPIQIGAPVVASPSAQTLPDSQAPAAEALEPEQLFGPQTESTP